MKQSTTAPVSFRNEARRRSMALSEFLPVHSELAIWCALPAPTLSFAHSSLTPPCPSGTKSVRHLLTSSACRLTDHASALKTSLIGGSRPGVMWSSARYSGVSLISWSIERAKSRRVSYIPRSLWIFPLSRPAFRRRSASAASALRATATRSGPRISRPDFGSTNRDERASRMYSSMSA